MTPETITDRHEHHHAHGPANRRRWIMPSAAPLFVRFPMERANTGVLVLHDEHGLDARIEQYCREIASAGNVVAAPYLYYETGGTEFSVDAGGAALAAMAEISPRDLDTDVTAAVEHFEEKAGVPADQVGIIGFGLGGYLAARASTQHALAGAVAVDHDEHLPVPWCGVEPITELLVATRTPWLGLLRGTDGTGPARGALHDAVERSNGMAEVCALSESDRCADGSGALNEALRFLQNRFYRSA